VPEGGPALVHHLGLALGIEVLRDLAHDAHDLALPGFQQRRILLDEVQQVLLWFGGEACLLLAPLMAFRVNRYGPPQIIDLTLQVFFALALAAPFLLGGQWCESILRFHTLFLHGMTRVVQVYLGIAAVESLSVSSLASHECKIANI